MKFVPMAFTCTLRSATSDATLRTSMLAAARAVEYSGAPGVGRAPAALREDEDLTAATLDHGRHDGAQEEIRRLDAPDEHPTQVIDLRSQEAADEDRAGERHGRVQPSEPGERRVDEFLGRTGSRKIPATADYGDLAPGTAHRIHEVVCGVTKHEIVSRRKQAGQRRPDVLGGVADDRDGTRTHAQPT